MSDGTYGYLGLTVPIDETLEDFLPGRSLLVKAVEVDEVGIQVRYEVRPPIAERPTPRDASWLLSATDDRGNDYVSAGGAYGVAPTGEFSEGVHTLTPSPQPGTAFVDIGFIGPASGEDEEPQHEIRVRLR